MKDPRVDNLARILVGYSTKVGEGEVVAIDGESAAEPLLTAIYEEVLKAGANPILNVALEGQAPTYYSLPATSSSTGSRRSRSGWSRTSTCGSRSEHRRTRASFPQSRRSGRQSARRRWVS